MRDGTTHFSRMNASGEAGNSAILVVMLLATIATMGNLAMRAQTDNAAALLQHDQLRARLRAGADSALTYTESLLARRLVAIDCKSAAFVPGINAGREIADAVRPGKISLSNCTTLSDAEREQLYHADSTFAAVSNCDFATTVVTVPEHACGGTSGSSGGAGATDMKAEVDATTTHLVRRRIAVTASTATSVSFAARTAANSGKANRSGSRGNLAAGATSTPLTVVEPDRRLAPLTSRALLPLAPESLCDSAIPKRRMKIASVMPGTSICGWTAKDWRGKIPESPDDYDYAKYHGVSDASVTLSPLEGKIICAATFKFDNPATGRPGQFTFGGGDVFITWNNKVIMSSNGNAVGLLEGVGPTRTFNWTNLENQNRPSTLDWCPSGVANNSWCYLPGRGTTGPVSLSLDRDIVRSILNPGGTPMSLADVASVQAPVFGVHAVGVRTPSDCTSSGGLMTIEADVIDPAELAKQERDELAARSKDPFFLGTPKN